MMNAPKNGDMYRCTKCEFEIHVTKGCNCKECKTELNCCGEAMEKVTEPEVQKT